MILFVITKNTTKKKPPKSLTTVCHVAAVGAKYVYGCSVPPPAVALVFELLGLAGGIGVEVVVGGVAAEEVGWGVSEGSARKGWRSASAGVMRVSGSSVSMLLNKSSICLPTHKRPVSTGV